MSRVPRYLWPADHQRQGQPFRDGEVEAAARKAAEPYAHLPVGEALRKIAADEIVADEAAVRS